MAEPAEELLMECLARHSVEESIHMLFQFISDRIPLNRILCMEIDRRQKKLEIYIDYSSSSETDDAYSIMVSSVLSRKKVYDMLVDRENRINVVVDTRNDPDLWEHIQTYKELYRSSMNMILKDNPEEDIIHSLLVTALVPNQFSQEHVRILASLRRPIQELTARYFASTLEPHLVLTTDGPLPAGSEALLRRCPGLASVMDKIDVLAESDATILIQGQTGTGKELVAESLHALSPRARAPFVKVNCGAIPETLVDSSFFGSEKGAFTGAVMTRKGFFEQAQGGTLYLDEIGELSLNAQIRLLRVLETREVQRIGGERRIPVNVRVIAATHRDLWAMASAGRFREDLCYRLHIYPLFLPALNERPGDVPVLVDYFYKLYSRHLRVEPPPFLTARTMKQLMRNPWPGNVRQLRYAVEHAMLDAKIAARKSGRPQELRFDVGASGSSRPGGTKSRRRAPDAGMAEEIRRALAQCQGKIYGTGGAAEWLDINPSTLRSRMRILNIPFPGRIRRGQE